MAWALIAPLSVANINLILVIELSQLPFLSMSSFTVLRTNKWPSNSSLYMWTFGSKNQLILSREKSKLKLAPSADSKGPQLCRHWEYDVADTDSGIRQFFFFCIGLVIKAIRSNNYYNFFKGSKKQLLNLTNVNVYYRYYYNSTIL